MTDEEAKALKAQIDAQIMAKIRPLAHMMSGMEMAILHLINILHHRGIQDRLTVATSYETTAQNLEGQNGIAPAIVLRQLAALIRRADDADRAGRPTDVREMLRVLPGGLSETPDEKTPEEPR